MSSPKLHHQKYGWQKKCFRHKRFYLLVTKRPSITKIASLATNSEFHPQSVGCPNFLWQMLYFVAKGIHHVTKHKFPAAKVVHFVTKICFVTNILSLKVHMTKMWFHHYLKQSGLVIYEHGPNEEVEIKMIAYGTGYVRTLNVHH